MLEKRRDGFFDVTCSRCVAVFETGVTMDVVVANGWELRDDGQTWCAKCSVDARTPLGRPNQRGVVKRRRR